jgi:hypothetical protein
VDHEKSITEIVEYTVGKLNGDDTNWWHLTYY